MSETLTDRLKSLHWHIINRTVNKEILIDLIEDALKLAKAQEQELARMSNELDALICTATLALTSPGQPAMTFTERSTPLSRHLRMIAGGLDDTHVAASINTAADILEAIAGKPAMTVNAQTMLELAEQCAKYDFDTIEMIECKWELWDQILEALRSPAIAGVAAREALERIIKIDQHEKKITVEADPAGNTYRVEMIDGPCATVARDALAALPQEVSAQPQAETYTDPAELWDRYCEEVPAKRRSPQGAMAFAVIAAIRAFASEGKKP